MGNKVNPNILRIGIIKSWKSKWLSDNNYVAFLKEDYQVRRFLSKKLRGSGVDSVEIEKSEGNLTIIIHASKPGIIIGRGGSGVEDLRISLKKYVKDKKSKINLNIQEVKQPFLSASIVAENISLDLEKRMPFRRIMKNAIEQVKRVGALGVKVSVAGRLNGAEIARRETLSSGSIPLHTLRADIDYAKVEANTTYGVIGVKVWIYKGQVFNKQSVSKELSGGDKPLTRAVRNKQ